MINIMINIILSELVAKVIDDDMLAAPLQQTLLLDVSNNSLTPSFQTHLSLRSGKLTIFRGKLTPYHSPRLWNCS